MIIKVPAPIYDTIRMHNSDAGGGGGGAGVREGRSKSISLGTRLRSIFGGCGKS